MRSQIFAFPFTSLHQGVTINMQLAEESVQLELLCTVAFHKQHKIHYLVIKLNATAPHSVFMVSIQKEMKDEWNNVTDSNFVLSSNIVHIHFYSMYFMCFKAIGRQSLSLLPLILLFFFFWKQFNSKTRDGFTVNTKVPSLKDQGKEYDGFTITITGDKYVHFFQGLGYIK